ncbi:hypothetical protein FA048_00025 [Pedobacter polaris]|uniref:Uncharacterized protein n=1 Tax=Pedobacter polaris TaxID=2571273 RepID=A0A4U1CSF5_9SPHI|nr:hypothetical protein [Pedobacter polaris]TKC12041.1 hypothetical protein FA048_00025 [Pedobacter polaris]
MKLKRIIKISGDKNPILSVSLKDILGCIKSIERITWAILWLEAVAALENNTSIVHLEDKINNSDNATIISWEQLLILSNQIIQGINLLILGDKKQSNLKKYLKDEDMFMSCDYTIELIDSSYWIIHSNDEDFFNNVFESLSGVEYVSS